MSRVIHVFRTPDRFVAGTVGEPGDRTFYLQAVDDAKVVSVQMEKEQVAVLAERLSALLDEVVRRLGTDSAAEPGSLRWIPNRCGPPSSRSSGSAPWGWAGTSSRGRSSWSCSP